MYKGMSFYLLSSLSGEYIHMCVCVRACVCVCVHACVCVCMDAGVFNESMFLAVSCFLV